MKKWLVAVLLGTLLVLGACGGGSSDGNSGDNGGDAVAAGETVYQKSCASCHGKDLSNGSAPDLSSIGSSHSADEILNIVENGQGGMPGGLATGDDAQDVADWLAEKK